MHFNSQMNEWPTITHPDDLIGTGERIAHAIEEMEDQWNHQNLQANLDSINTQELLGRQLAIVYKKLSISPTESLKAHRKRWIGSALDEFGTAWNPLEASFQAGCD